MIFEKGHVYHIYNQGNNNQRIFFKRENYLFFLRKIRRHILPFADIVAYCLMPNHFHLMVRVNRETTATDSEGFAQSEALAFDSKSLNFSIGIMLRAYTNAINKQKGMSGSLFRKQTKAECLSCSDGLQPSFYNTNRGAKINIIQTEQQYIAICFDYIHQNPVVANMVKNQVGWEFSSARDYAGVRKGSLINKGIILDYTDEDKNIVSQLLK